MARDIAYRWHKMNSAREAVFVKEGQTGDSANDWEKEVRTSLNSNNVECWTSGTSEDICSRSFKKEEKKLCSEAAKGQLQPHRPTCFSSAHQDYNIWLHNIANTHADKSPYATMQTIPPKGLFSLRDVQRGAAKKTGSATSLSLHHDAYQHASSRILALHYALKIDFLSCLLAVPARIGCHHFSCYYRILEHKRREKCAACPGEIKNEQEEILWWLTWQDHSVCLCDCCGKLKTFLL